MCLVAMHMNMLQEINHMWTLLPVSCHGIPVTSTYVLLPASAFSVRQLCIPFIVFQKVSVHAIHGNCDSMIYTLSLCDSDLHRSFKYLHMSRVWCDTGVYL